MRGNAPCASKCAVNSGTLCADNLSGSATGTSPLEVFSGATLTGFGIIGGATTVDNGATLAPGDPVGTLTFTNNLTLNDNSILQFGLGTNTDSIVVNGDLNLTGQLNVTNAGGFGVGVYPLFICGGALNLGNLTLASAPAGFKYSFGTNSPGVVQLIVAPLTPPVFDNVNVVANTLTLSGNNGVPLGNYFVLESSNLLNWSVIATNQFDAGGNFNFTTNAPAGSPPNFFRLQLP